MQSLLTAVLFSTLGWDDIYPNLMESLNILWQGLLAILIVVGVIIAVTYIMQRASETARAKKADDNGKTDPPENDER